MAISKDEFQKYASSRENTKLSKALEGKKKYTHNRVFDGIEEEDNSSNASYENSIISVDPNRIENWQYHDRLEYSLGDIDGLANEFKKIGQQQPCVVRPSPTTKNSFELIIGERRWRAAKKASINLMVIVKDIDDKTAALAQAAENDNRENLSDYEKGMSLSNLIKDGIIKQKDLTEKLGRTRQYISALLSFSKIPEDIVAAIGDISKFSAVTAERIKQISSRSDEHKSALLRISDKLNGKNPSAGYIEKEVEDELNKKDLKKSLESEKLFTKDGRHIATWRLNNNGMLALNLPKGINNLITHDKIGRDKLSKKIIEVIENELNDLK